VVCLKCMPAVSGLHPAGKLLVPVLLLQNILELYVVSTSAICDDMAENKNDTHHIA